MQAGKLGNRIQEYDTGNGKRYRVRWWDNGKQKSRSFLRIKDAQTFAAETVIAKNQGRRVNMPRSSVTLAEYVRDEWWPNHAEVELAEATRKRHKNVYNKWILPKLGGESLTAIDTEDLIEWQAECRKEGAQAPTIRRASAVLSGIYTYASQRPRRTGVSINPVTAMPKPKRKKKTQLRVYGPDVWEAMRDWMRTTPTTKHKRKLGERDAMMVSLLCYAGLRPGEMLFLRGKHIKDDYLLIEGGVSLGSEQETKTGDERRVPIIAPLREDLNEYIKEHYISDNTLLFSNKQSGAWSDELYRNWRTRRWRKAAREVADLTGEAHLATDRPYAARHSYASLMIRAGWYNNPNGLAKIMGHDVAVLLSTYSSEIEQFEGADPIDLEEEIWKARHAI